MYTNARFWSTVTTSDLHKNHMNDKIFEKINIKIVMFKIKFNVPLHEISANLESFRF